MVSTQHFVANESRIPGQGWAVTSQESGILSTGLIAGEWSVRLLFGAGCMQSGALGG